MLIKNQIVKRRFILCLILLFSFIIFNICYLYFFNNSKNNLNQISNVLKNLKIQEESNNKYATSSLNDKDFNTIKKYKYEDVNAFLSIPVIGLYKAPIKEGTSQEVMKRYIGHFENTSFDLGNIGLASHNRGMGANYFEKLYKLKKGDYILYTYKNCTKRYEVDKKVVIDSYDWSYLKNTQDNVLTMITCIENRPNFRLCIQAIQI